MSEWISIKEACRITGKSDSTIRKLVKTGYADSSFDIKIEKQGRCWKVDKDSLLSYYQSVDSTVNSNDNQSVDSNDQDARLIDSLQDRIESMQEQLENKDSQIQALNVHLARANERVEMLEKRIAELEGKGRPGLIGRIMKMLPGS